MDHFPDSLSGYCKSPLVGVTPCQYAVKQVNMEAPNHTIVFVTFILLVDQNRVPVRVTHLQDYIADGIKLSSPFKSYNKKRCLYFVGVLNYILFEKYNCYHISSVLHIERFMMQDYFDKYAGEIDSDSDDPRRPETTWECVRVCTFTMYHLCKKYGNEMLVKIDDLVHMKTFTNFRGQQVTELVPTFEVHDYTNVWADPIFREIPTKAFELLISLAFRHTPDIAFGLCLEAFGGLRPGEVCCVRQECSSLGPGIIFSMGLDGHSIPAIDLRKALILRKDAVSVGGIKCSRVQRIYPDFVDAFHKAYQFHKEYLSQFLSQNEYAPMFLNSKGKAMTYDVYANRFQLLVQKYFIPSLLQNEDNELHIYGTILQEHSLGLHALRHFFTVQLVLRGLNAAQIMEWRGDHCIDSANTYIARKSELIKLAKSTGSSLTDLLIRSVREARHV